jgi:hypothetical protein
MTYRATVSKRVSYRSRVVARRGISLLEVIITMVILLSSVMVLSRLAFLARQHAVGGEDRTKAQMLCANIMSELVSGSIPMQNVSPQVFEGDAWMYSIDVQSVGMMPLAKVTVKVFRLPEEVDGVATDISADDEIPTYQLVQWVRAADIPFDGGLDTDAGAMTEPDLTGQVP